MTASMTTSRPDSALRQCQRTTDIPVGPHAPHGWQGRICPGLGELEALTLSQIEAIADALDMSPFDLTLSLIAHREANR